MLLLKNCRFVPFLTEGVDFAEGDVLLDGDKIVRIAPTGTDMDADAQVLDLAGKTLLPGLIDMHVHLMMQDYDQMMNGHDKGMTVAQWALNVAEYAEKLLDAGYTTVRDAGDNPEYPAVFLRQAIMEGRLVGPNIYTSGPIICPTYTQDHSLTVTGDGPVEVKKMARNNLSHGADYIKIYSSGSLLMMSNEPGFPILEPDEIEAAVSAARMYSTYVAAHAHGATAIQMCLEAGVHTIEHASMITEESLQYIEDNKLDVGLVPTLYAFNHVAEDSDDNPNAVRARKLFDKIVSCLKNAYSHKDIPMGWGTDVELKVFKCDPMKEFRLRKELLDFSNEDILKQATVNSARLMGIEDKVGTVKVEKQADLIVVDGDPALDITVLYNKPVHVIKSGKLLR